MRETAGQAFDDLLPRMEVAGLLDTFKAATEAFKRSQGPGPHDGESFRNFVRGFFDEVFGDDDSDD